MMEKDLVDKSLREIFEKRELKTEPFVIILDSARNKSVGVKSLERSAILRNIDFKKISKSLATIVLSVTVVVGTVNFAKSTYSESMEHVSIEIGSSLYSNESSVVGKNTFRHGDIVYYNQESIAKDLLQLPSEIFDYAFCTICNDMGSNLNNKVGVLGKSNIDTVIYYLKNYSSVDGVYYNEKVSNAFNNIDSFNEYLIKNGYVDKAGNPSFSVFKESCDKNVQDVLAVIQNQNNKGVSRS